MIAYVSSLSICSVNILYVSVFMICRHGTFILNVTLFYRESWFVIYSMCKICPVVVSENTISISAYISIAVTLRSTVCLNFIQEDTRVIQDF